ncbi:hypothetical protein AUJ95_04180 [Candidatus Desantisbacteria bacterium CG2_30_40_21]|uniref:DUF4282 domain-containing protein n=4 Tax=unclassified Candidatus Desantisiibacteriota TaxID=3106372 RepID=A0A2M7JDV7_9BACT|nr:MAG: hypothetical protein AUJ95_04180 [Candidatus Desantisbacteria bacterium CG2_30_40_21]PIP40926.1 MAG: hypothetical protein COX18_05085 [Candidatus Desantisbacteria bacterium CG23_combo_of_CG06-09_8_20_14_all_40_23]PIX17585.1 MAG: hypothetical protein COZ71_02565 [Candidatus Desantisbacteria bacterium CG_4_8_14_3_um_filter_40_12]PJB27898.1 MAG: hypothetical protein CO110_10915 [Candidatus Desantisbacteria bacterium CG_4_9_14_3_um_filter_40_11]
MTEYLKERIKYLTELLKVFWTGFLLTVGGISSLLLQIDSPIKVILILSGLIPVISFITILIVLGYKIDQLINQLKNKEDISCSPMKQSA